MHKTNNLTKNETQQIAIKVEKDLISHLYKSTLSGVYTGSLASLSILAYLYFNEAQLLPKLLIWCFGFNALLLILVMVYLAYNKIKNYATFKLWKWKYAFFSIILLCSMFWGALIFFMTDNFITQFVIIIMMVMLASAYSMGTVGWVALSVATLLCILSPLAVWAFMQGSVHFITGGVFVIVYFLYLIGMNYRSTNWLIESLQLEIETSFFTHQANHDIVTGLPNHRQLSFHLEHMISKSLTRKANFMVIYFSVNGIEMIGSSIGFQVADELMILLTRRFNTLLDTVPDRENYFIATPRSDTFAIVIEGVNPKEDFIYLQTIASVLSTPFYLNNKENKFTASMGVCFFPKDGVDTETLLRNAHAAMLQACQKGWGYIEYYQRDINSHLPRRLELTTALHHAVANDDFIVFYQPIVLAAENRICGAEALVRWKHQEYGFINTQEFINLAEEIGLINKIGELVFKRACQQQRNWQTELGINIKISVNVSLRQLHNNKFIAMVEEQINKGLVDPKTIEFELTESEILDEQAIPSIKKLAEMGFTLAIDDFGTGYAGMKFLQKFTIEKIKIDKSFVLSLPHNAENKKLVLSILAMAKQLEIKTLAEGVENAQQRDFLSAHECDYLQGYYYSKPVKAEEFAKLLTASAAAADLATQTAPVADNTNLALDKPIVEEAS